MQRRELRTPGRVELHWPAPVLHEASVAYPTKICRNCKQGPVSRPRGLCWSCYYRPGVREQYLITSKFARKGIGAGNPVVRPTEPTDAHPATEAKILVMQERAQRGEALFHAHDRRRSLC